MKLDLDNDNKKITREIKTAIKEKWEKVDRNGDSYLILKLENGDTTFVFPKKVQTDKWAGLEKGREFKFTVEEGRNANSILVDYE